jgi:hypothetical protein
MVANGAALLFADVASFLISVESLNRRVRKRKTGAIAAPPRLTILVYSTSLFFLYGAVYNLFMFTDRLTAWTSAAGRSDYLPYPIWVDGPYELGMDIALIVVVLLMGMVEHITQRFSGRLIANQERVASTASEDFNSEFVRFYRRRLIGFAMAGIASVILAFLALVALRRLGAFAVLASPTVSAVVRRVFWIASISYVFLMAALLNALILLSLSRVNLVLKAIVPALAANAVVGFICSRAIHYSLAAVGLLAGSLVFCILSTIITHRVMRRLDYYYYSAY